MGGRLPCDEEASADLARMDLDGVVQELHDLDLRERRPEIQQRIGELSPQDPVDTPLRIDQSPSTRSLPFHRQFLPRCADMADMREGVAQSEPPPVRVLTDRTPDAGASGSVPL